MEVDLPTLRAGLSKYAKDAANPPQEKRSVVMLRMTPEEHEALKKAAHRAELSMNSYAMQVVLSAVIRTLSMEEDLSTEEQP